MVENGYYSFGSGNERSGYVSGTNNEHPELTINGGTFTGGLNTIKNDDNGIVTIANGNFSNFYQCVIQNHNDAMVTGGTFVATNDSANTNTTYGVYNCGCNATHDIGELKITGGTFNGADFAVADVSDTCGSINISGGNFTGNNGALGVTENHQADISITGGTFSSNVSDYVPTNYECADNDDGTYTVSKLDDKLVVKPGTDGSATLEGDFGTGGTIEDSTGNSNIENNNVTVDMTTTGGSNDSATLNITASTAQSLGDASSFTVKTNAGTVTLDSTALDKVSKTEANVEITIEKTESTDANVAASYTISVTASNTDLLPDGEINGNITISVPLPTGTSVDSLYPWYVVTVDNVKTYVEELTKVASAEGMIAFQIGHLSDIELLTEQPETRAVANVTTSGSTVTPYTDLAEAITAAGSNGGTVDILVDGSIDIGEAEFVINHDVTINGKGGTIFVTVVKGTDEKDTGNIAFNVTGGATFTLNNVNMTIDGTENANFAANGYDGTAFNVGIGSKLVINDSTVLVYNIERSTTAGGGYRASFEINDSHVTFQGIDGNAANGGNWTIKDDSILSLENVGSYGLSANSITTENSTIYASNVGYSAIYAYKSIDFGANTDVNIENCGTKLPYISEGNYGDAKAPIQMKVTHEEDDKNTEVVAEDLSFDIASTAMISITDCVSNGVANNTIYIPANVTFENNGYIDGNVETSEDSNYVVVTYMSGGTRYDFDVVEKGYISLIDGPVRSGADFRGWRCSSDGKLYDARARFHVTGDTTFTAEFTSRPSPDPAYDIDIDDTSNGSVSTNLSNASAGATITVTVTPDEGYVLGSLTVTGPDGRVDVTRVNATTYTFKMPEGDVTVDATFVREGLPFTDVATSAWYYDAVVYVYNNGLMDGVSSTQFNPDGAMTRAMVWAILARIDGETITGSNWVSEAQSWAVASGVSDGTDANGAVTREQLVTMLWRFAGEPETDATLSAWSDAASVSDWAEAAMAWAVDEGVITGVGASTIDPMGGATRAQCATILMRSIDKI